MPLTTLKITHVRNLQTVSVELSPFFNIVYGENGSGKSSFLEAIHLLATGRSFRTHLAQHMINHQAMALSVFGIIADEHNQQYPVGIERQRNGEVTLRINGASAKSIAELAYLLPARLIHHESFELLEGGPKRRRAFLDWGLFHVEHSFYPLWKDFQRCLKQRNALLKVQASSEQMKSWDHEFVTASIPLDALRKNYLEQLLLCHAELVAHMPEIPQVSMAYYQGWSEKKELAEALMEHLARDREFGFSQYGPQRADLQVRVNASPAQEILSRGQQKLLISTLALAQGLHLQRSTNKRVVYLIDDLTAELDERHSLLILEILKELRAQVFITVIAEEKARQLCAKLPQAKMFHVEQGMLRE